MTNRTLITAAAALLTLATVYGIAYIHGRASIVCPQCTASLGDLQAARREASVHRDSASYHAGMAQLWRDIAQASIEDIQPITTRRTNVTRTLRLQGADGYRGRLMQPAADLRTVIDSIRSKVDADTTGPARLEGLF